MKRNHLSKEHRRKLSEAHKDKKHSKETRRKISEALKKHAGWWKGKKFSKNHKKRLSEAHTGQSPWNKGLTKFTDKRVALYGENGGKSRKGKKLSEETKQKISIHRKGKKLSEKVKRNMNRAQKKAKKEMFAKMTKGRRREYCKSWIESGHANPSSIEKAIRKVLNGLGIGYKTQVPFSNHKFVVDIYIPNRRLIIECNGNYWHNYIIFPEKKIRDNALEKYAKNNGYKLIWLWESNIRENPEATLIKGLKEIKEEIYI